MRDNSASAQEDPIVEMKVRNMLYARAINAQDMQYATSAEVPRIFQITFSDLNRDIGSMAATRKPAKGAKLSLANIKPHVQYPGVVEGENEYGFNEHLFQKEFTRRSIVIGLFKGKKNTLFKCKHCTPIFCSMR